jgi:hypothetical protein
MRLLSQANYRSIFIGACSYKPLAFLGGLPAPAFTEGGNRLKATIIQETLIKSIAIIGLIASKAI